MAAGKKARTTAKKAAPTKTKKSVKSAVRASGKKAVKKTVATKSRKPSPKLGPDGRPILPLGKGKLGYTTSNVFSQSIPEVWDAVTKAEHLTKHFIDDMIGQFGPQLGPVTWKWGEHP